MSEIDYTLKDTYLRRSENLDIEYKEFLKSDYWKKVKAKAARRLNYQKCEFCGSKKGLELHHSSYKWIGTKFELRAILALCRTHHQEVHDLSVKLKISVRLATNRLRKAYKKHGQND